MVTLSRCFSFPIDESSLFETEGFGATSPSLSVADLCSTRQRRSPVLLLRCQSPHRRKPSLMLYLAPRQPSFDSVDTAMTKTVDTSVTETSLLPSPPTPSPIEIRNNKLEMQSVNQRSLIIELDKLLKPLSIPSELCLRVVNYRSLSLVNLLSLEFNLMMFQWVQYSACLTGDSFDEPKKLQNVCEWLISAMQGLDVPNIDPTFAKMRAVKEKRGEHQILKSTFVRKASEFLRNYFASFTEFMMNDKSYFSQQGQLKSPDHADPRFNCRTYAGLLQYLKVVWMNYNLCSRADGEREFLFFRNPSADMLLHESELDIKLIKQAKIFHYGSINLIDEPCKSAHLAALRIAKDSGCILSYDPNLRLALWPSAEAAREGIMSIWDEADVIQEFKGRVAGVKVKPVDRTGAGDAFVGGFVYNIASDQNVLKVIQDFYLTHLGC
ncbi:hypothetical protein RIF29_09666 [Crotalaria pallida]|uniref:Carbohydrate kinase PfkB domain-containing protein n=1 Tax=Crotalaria pallida TaxID=3830 RepID=A0AAN9FS54_CROPI